MYSRSRHRLGDALDDAMRFALAGDDAPLRRLAATDAPMGPRDERDALTTLLHLHALHLAPVETLAGREWLQHHPGVAALKQRLEARVVARLDEDAAPLLASLTTDLDAADPADPAGTAATVRRLTAANLVPPVYEWLATDADHDVHTELHRRLSRALDVPSIPLAQLPVPALRRTVLNGVLATNRAFQPEMLGALGVLELQAGPRCRKVLAALERLGAPTDAAPFYAEHAATDPRHGKEWLDTAITPLAAAQPDWAHRLVRGAAWRCVVNDGLFDHLDRTMRPRPARVPAAA